MMKKVSCLLFFACSLSVNAQNFTYEAIIESVTEEGYYKIRLTPELLGKLNSSFSDLRVHNQEGVEMPYVLQSENSEMLNSIFIEYKIIEQQSFRDSISFLVFHNPDKIAIDNVSIHVRNTDVQKVSRLSGSDDSENWYIIKDNYYLNNMSNGSSTSELTILDFPLSNYRYFRLEIDDRESLPINIISVGFYDNQKLLGMTTSFECHIDSQRDSLDQTLIKIKFDEKVYLEKLKFSVSEAQFYSRNARVLVEKTRKSKKKTIEYLQPINSFTLASNGSNDIDLGSLATDEFYIEIDNQDDQPLSIDKISASFLNKYLLVKLSSKNTYTIRFGAENISLPIYDLREFVDEVKVNEAMLSHSKPMQLTNDDTAEMKPSGIFDNKYLVWLAILLVGGAIVYVTIRMVKTMDDK